MLFKELELGAKLNKNIEKLGYESPTEIQEKAIPLLLDLERDFIGQAQTGTGKTAAFLLPLLKRLDSNSKNINALILSPTRELANQINEEFMKLAPDTGLKSEVIYGGSSYDRQIRGVKRNRPQVIIGTPGRVIDLVDKGILNFNETEYFVLDEADEMLNMGFLEDVQRLMTELPSEKKIWMFSATMPKPIKNLVKKEFNEPEIVQIEKKAMTAESIEQMAFGVKRKYFSEALRRIIDTESEEVYGIIFCRTKLETADLANDLTSKGYRADMLHGDMGQAQRDAAMSRFKKKKTTLLVCTDVAARGIDVNNLTHVFNYDLPQDAESYVHRIGRTGRAGLKGKAITITERRGLGRLRWIQKTVKSEIDFKRIPDVSAVKDKMIERKVDQMKPLMDIIQEKGDEFKVDEAYATFEKFFSDFSAEEMKKLMFSFSFNGEFRRMKDLGDIEDAPQKRERNSRSQGRRGERGGRDNSTRRDRDRGNSDGSLRDRPRRDRTPRSGDIRLFMNMGKDDGLGLHLLLGQIAHQTGVKRNNINNVQVKDRFSFFDIPPQYGKKLIETKNMKIKDNEVRFEHAGK